MRAYPPTKAPLGSQPALTATADALEFDSRFESGNLRKAIRVSRDEYNLFLEYDVETRGHTQWYYFAVKNFNNTSSVRFNMATSMRKGGSPVPGTAISSTSDQARIQTVNARPSHPPRA